MTQAISNGTSLATLEQTFFDMFIAEWRVQRGEQPLRYSVILDDDPYPQYLAPEFELCRHLFMQQGIGASIADPRELEWHNGSFWHGNKVVDMVYNRSTFFILTNLPTRLCAMPTPQAQRW